MLKNKLLVFIVTYNSSFRLKIILSKLRKIQSHTSFDILVSDDCSNDDTIKYFPTINKRIFTNINKKNLGYGGNVKKCLKFAIKKKYSHAVMIHGDNQYDARYIKDLYNKIKDSKVDAVTGSRMINPIDALGGKMPIYKLIGNLTLTKIFNLLFSTNFTDAHTGLWLYNIATIKKINIKNIDDKYNFDNQLRIKLIKQKKKIIEIPIKTYYRNEKSSFHIMYAIKFILDIIKQKFV